MTQPPNVPPPPEYSPPPAVYGVAPGYTPPGGYAGPATGGGPGHGRVSPNRLIITFVVVLGIGLALGAIVLLAFQPGARKPDCPDPTIACGAPPVAPTLPPIAAKSPAPAPTPAATIVRPSGSLVISSAAPSVRPSTAPTPAPTVAATAGPTSAPTTAPTPAPTSAPSAVIADLPQPRPASGADALHDGAVWTSSSIGFSVEYDDKLWEILNESPNAVSLTAGNGAVVVVVEGFKGSGSTIRSLIQQKIKGITDAVLGLTEEADPSRQLPGKPVIGHVQGEGTLMNGTINTPQGPGAAVDVVVLASAQGDISLRVTVVADDDLRDPAFSVADSILNAITWPAEAQ